MPFWPIESGDLDHHSPGVIAMTMEQTLSCYLIGADSLLVECGELLLTGGHRIDGVITATPRIASWAKSKSIPVIPLDDAYEDRLAELAQSQPFDYLFSITHLALINDRVLDLPARMAVNFHDGPLPAYAGLNAPAWALLNGERQYGISWHVISSGVDTGELLEQDFFDIAEDETSLSINTKCFAAAIDSFPKLLGKLLSGQVHGMQQDLSKRSYFGKYQRPETLGIIDWTSRAKDIEALVRAMDFGDYPNPLTTAKLVMGSGILIATSALAVEEANSATPGTILDVGEGEIRVACGEGCIALTGLKDLSGRALTPGEAAGQYSLQRDRQLPLLDEADRSQIAELSKTLVRGETDWIETLRYLDPVEVPFAGPTKDQQAADDGALSTIDIPIEAALPTAGVAAAYGLLLARLSRKADFDLAFSHAGFVPVAGPSGLLRSPYSALHLDYDLNASLGESLTAAEGLISSAEGRLPWATDLIVRVPELVQKPELADQAALPMGLAIGDGTTALPCKAWLQVSLDGSTASFNYRRDAISESQAKGFCRQLGDLLTTTKEQPDSPSGEFPLLSEADSQQILVDWNATHVDFDRTQCLHQLFEQQVQRTPDATALVFEDESVSYAELNRRANQLAAHLIAQGVAVEDFVGIHISRSIDLMVATIATHKAGAAYVPLDPAFPADRIAYMVQDAGMKLILSQSEIQGELPETDAQIVLVDRINTSTDPFDNPSVDVGPENLAYVIYTSGSTGNPKGVMVEHRNVVNFFVGMDDRIVHEERGAWLAVTSLSFDISVLELFWTLTRGFKVVVYREDRGSDASSVSYKVRQRPMEFGLFMWGNDDGPGRGKYRLMIEGSKFFDQNGFDSVWTPERHFSAFGGPYPNPALTSAAIAAVTERISIRSGSLVSPLHHPLRIAEDWSVIDNLSNGRVGLSFAAGWQPNDFVIMPQNFKNNKAVMLEQIDTVRKLWRGDKVSFENPLGDQVELETLPRPVQKELPTWLTTAGNPETYRMAGERDMNVLTHLLGQSLDEVAEKIRVYREARKNAGLDPAAGKVTLMLHTFVGEDTDEVRELVRQPMKDYLRSAIKLVIDFAWTFPAFKRPGGANSKPEDIDIKSLSEEEVDTILDFAFERYFETSGLFGSPETCQKMVERCKQVDVDEIACLLDFGVDTKRIMDGLPLLKQVRDEANRLADGTEGDIELDQSWAAQIERHGITHFQCTPSMARMLCFDQEARAQFPKLKQVMVGGEAFPLSLAKDLLGLVEGRLTNMYGPTETTIWSTTHDVDGYEHIPIGRPIANTQIYILDPNKQPVPPGVAGDLYIGGEGVVRGYLNREELTQERFVPDPFKSDGSKMYWTGDLARYRDDGVIEFLGRVDHQVKIRGYRIELGEIEALLCQSESVQESVLLLREDNPGDQRLVAYIVSGAGALDTQGLRDHLRSRLPEYMIPNDFVLLDAMPLTPNGKVDRKSLPAPDSNSQGTVAEYAEPENDLQRIIVEIWQDTLKVDRVGVNDNFFDLGGHSLLIVRVHQLLKERVEKPIALTDLYRFPTVRSLTDYLSAEDNTESLKKSSDRASRRRERLGLAKRRK
jgi:natural product biosynthesis luciferase-like monooxygenase protein